MMRLLRQPHEVAAYALAHNHVGVGLVDMFEENRRVASCRQKFSDRRVERIDRFLT